MASESLPTGDRPRQVSIRDLPAEVMTAVLLALATNENKDVLQFALANRWAFSHAKNILTRTLIFRIADVRQLDYDCAWIIKRLERYDSFHDVRRLVINGRLTGKPKDVKNREVTITETKENNYHGKYVSHRPRLKLPARKDFFDCDGGCYNTARTGSRQKAFENLWKPMAKLIDRLPGLMDIHFGCSTHFPDCILKAINDRASRCRLHFDHFFLKSVNSVEILPQELALMTSPCLSSIRIQNWQSRWYQDSGYMYQDWIQPGPENGRLHDDLEDQHSSVLRMMITGMAPNLDKVHVAMKRTRVTRGTPAEPYDIIQQLRLSHNYTFGHMRTLQIGPTRRSNERISLEEIQNWTSITDFEKLTALELRGPLDCQVLHHLIKKTIYRDLTSFTISDCNDQGCDGRHTTDATYDLMFDTLLQTIPPCKHVVLGGHPQPTQLRTIAQNHGKVLRQLEIFSHPGGFCTTSHDVDLIAEHCPELQRLKIPAKRSQGDEEEQALYTSIAKCSQLTELYLHFRYDALIYSADDKAWVLPSSEWHVKLALWINLSLDENLLREIFDLISSSKAPDTPKFQRLHVNSQKTMSSDWRAGSYSLMQYIGGEWDVRRSRNIDTPDILTFDCKNPHVNAKGINEYYADRVTQSDERGLPQAFNIIWKHYEEGVPWYKAWHAFPLMPPLEDEEPASYSSKSLPDNRSKDINRRLLGIV